MFAQAAPALGEQDEGSGHIGRVRVGRASWRVCTADNSRPALAHHRLLGVVPRLDRVGRREDRGASVQRADDARLGDRHRLLLHDLVQHRAGQVRHLVELVDATDATVRQDQRPGLEHVVASVRVLGHERSQADRGGALPGGVDPTGRDLVHVVEQLRLGGARVADQHHVELPARVDHVFRRVGAGFVVGAPEELAQDALFDVVELPDRGCQRLHQVVVDLRVAPNRPHLSLCGQGVSRAAWTDRIGYASSWLTQTPAAGTQSRGSVGAGRGPR
jgi:hypothetical protein